MMGEIDPDRPIPYRLTAAGHREVALWRAEQSVSSCCHRWRFRHGQLECDLCGIERQMPQSTASIPDYLRKR